ncbi:hypothetical protein VNO77_04659 [Canavalia gladiata]|uniref:Uncharacterized protein n=1 Tax=Canavalia gladiata TaxID=3824 RepID=A0AAN9N3F3_CANGL
MIGFRERERTRERRLSWARVAIFFLWVILVISLISLFFSIDNESKSNHSIRPPPPRPRLLKRPSFNRVLFHTPSTTTKTKLVNVNTKGDPEHSTLYGDDKRIIHTGPNPLHNYNDFRSFLYPSVQNRKSQCVNELASLFIYSSSGIAVFHRTMHMLSKHKPSFFFVPASHMDKPMFMVSRSFNRIDSGALGMEPELVYIWHDNWIPRKMVCVWSPCQGPVLNATVPDFQFLLTWTLGNMG